MNTGKQNVFLPRRFFYLMVAAMLLLTAFVVEIHADNEATDSSQMVGQNTSTDVSRYTDDWRYWSQGASQYYSPSAHNHTMRIAGCRVVAQSKMLVEMGIASDNVDEFNPDIYFAWCNQHSYFGKKGELYSSIDENNYVGISLIAFAESNGITVEKHTTVNLGGKTNSEKENIIMSYLDDGYYVMVGAGAHFVYIGRNESLCAHSPVFYDSWKQYSANPSLVSVGYENACTNNSTIGQLDNLYLFKVTDEITKTYTISPKCAPNSNLDIDGGGSANGAKAIIWEKHGGDNQKFRISCNDGIYTITAVSSGKPLDVKGGEAISGTIVQQYESNNTDSQKWHIVNAGNGYCYIVSALDTSLYLDVCGGENRNGNDVQVYTVNHTAAQLWKLTPIDTVQIEKNNSHGFEVDGIITGKYFTIKNAQSGKMLNVWCNRSANGTNITIWSEDGTNGEAFCAYKCTNGFYLVPMCATSSAVNVRGYKGDTNRNVDVWEQTKHDSQLWKLVYNEKLNGYNLLCVEDTTQALAETGIKDGANVCLKTYDSNDLSQVWVSEMFVNN